VPRSIHKCPKCGEPVSAFAAGCAICGADLGTARAQLAEKRDRSPVVRAGRHVPSVSFGGDGFQIVVAVLLALFAPILGFALAGFLAWNADQEGRIRTRNIMLVIVGFTVVMLATGGVFGRFVAGY
jgi:hypothetical protein